MVTYNEYLKNILTQILDSYNKLQEINDKPGDLEYVKKELLKINGFMRVVVNKIDTDKIPASDFKSVKSKFGHYFDNYLFVEEIERMEDLYSNDPSRIKNMRFKILEALDDKKMMEEVEDLVDQL